MSTRYAFKVHSMELARGLRGRKRLHQKTSLNVDEAKGIAKGEETEPAARDYLDDLLVVLRQLQASELSLTDVPKLIAVADGANEHISSTAPGTPRMVVNSVEVKGRRVSVVVEYGHLGYSHRAVGLSPKDEAVLTDMSPVQYYRTEFLVPAKGTHGIVVTEIISSSSSLQALTAWINHTMREIFGDESFPRLMVPALADKNRLNELVNGDTVAEIRLSKRGLTGDGLPDGGTIHLVEKVRTTKKMVNAQALIKGWVEHQQSDPFDEQQRLAQVELLAEIVDEKAKEMEFTDGLVRLDEGHGRFVSVSPSKVGEIFVYNISEHRPTRDVWEKQTEPQALAMAAADHPSVAWG